VDGELPTTREPMSGSENPRILCVGRVNRWKGQDILLEALATLAMEGIGFSCRLVGSPFPGDERLVDQLREQVAASGLGDRVVFEREVDDATEAMASADVVVVPSKVPEPFGKVVVEAMALGRPVIATTPGGPVDVIRSGVDGVLVPTGDVRALTAALRDLLQHPSTARRLGRAAAERARLFSEASTVRRIAADMLTIGRSN
jgi:glycosyltransferase involved in cell wall biosynthesis